MSLISRQSEHHIADIEREADRSAFDWFVFAFAVAFAVWHILTNLVWLEPGIWQNAIHFAGFAFLAAITTSFREGNQSKTMYYINIAGNLERSIGLQALRSSWRQ